MFGKWEVRELVYQINFPPFPARFDKRTKEQKLIFGIFVLLFVLDILHKYRYPKKGNIRPVFYRTKTVGIAHHYTASFAQVGTDLQQIC